MKPFRYLFYRLYQLMIRVGNGFVAEYYAILLMTTTIMLNIYAVVSLAYVFGQNINLGLSSTNTILLVASILTVIFYFSFVHNKKFLEIAKRYENETSKEKIRGMVFSISYFVLSIGLMIFCFYLMIKKNRGEL
ncbi:hypothetical protein [Agriterribacter sp.]|uniref:hypothetical protein n=1 Tax=Agriterribacter sp. TaxID=2821509 RepID=UPI002C888AAE|nr:hypothetical protein [Agriterribacter sp.]HTN06664.1 hypothetical protein [Agriterribacter sp.]